MRMFRRDMMSRNRSIEALEAAEKLFEGQFKYDGYTAPVPIEILPPERRSVIMWNSCNPISMYGCNWQVIDGEWHRRGITTDNVRYRYIPFHPSLLGITGAWTFKPAALKAEESNG